MTRVMTTFALFVPVVAASALMPQFRPVFLRSLPAVPRLAPVKMAAANSPAAVAGFVGDRAAGLALAGTIGFVAEATAKRVPISLSPLLYATAIGIALGNLLRLFDPDLSSLKSTAQGMAFAKKRLLRAGIILYGAKITFASILGIGWAGLLSDLYAVISTLLIGLSLGRALGLSMPLVTLISTGSAICGCSAVAATQPILDAEAHEVAAAVGVGWPSHKPHTSLALRATSDASAAPTPPPVTPRPPRLPSPLAHPL